MRSFVYSLIAIVTLIPTALFAQDNNLVNLPIGDTDDFNTYINALYLMFISIAALIAVIKIIIAGVKYMFSDIVTQKSEAKRDIQGALLGLLVVLAAVVVLTIINPDLTTFDPQIEGIPGQQQVTGQQSQPSDIERCASDGNCSVKACKLISPGPGKPTYDCNVTISECAGTGVQLNNNTVACSISAAQQAAIDEAEQQRISDHLDTIVSDYCPGGRTCRAELCDKSALGVFGTCARQCEDRNGIYDPTLNLESCVFTNEELTGIDGDGNAVVDGGNNNLNLDEDITYYQALTTFQEENQEELGIVPQELTSIRNSSRTGYVIVTYPDESESEMSCGSVTPNPCN